MMWIRYAVFCLFAWFVVRRNGSAGIVRARGAPGCRPSRSVLAVIESAIFVLAFKLPAAGRRPCHCRHRAADRDRARRAVPGRARRRGALAGRRRGLCGRAADRASRLQDVRLAIAAAAGRRRSCGPAIRSWCGSARARTRPRRRWSGRRSPPSPRPRWSGRCSGNGRTPSAGRLLIADRAAGRAGALRADQGARPCRGGRRAALQLHRCWSGSRSWAPWCSATFPTSGRMAGAAIIVASGLYTWHHDRRMNKSSDRSEADGRMTRG